MCGFEGVAGREVGSARNGGGSIGAGSGGSSRALLAGEDAIGRGSGVQTGRGGSSPAPLRVIAGAS